MCKLEYLSHILRKSSTQIHVICVKAWIFFYTFWVKVAHKFTQWNHLGFKLYSISRCFKKFTQLTKNLRDRRSHWSCQISTLAPRKEEGNHFFLISIYFVIEVAVQHLSCKRSCHLCKTVYICIHAKNKFPSVLKRHL